MTIENYSTIWELDHIIPIKFDHPTKEKMLERLHFKNIQPLLKNINREKGNRVE